MFNFGSRCATRAYGLLLEVFAMPAKNPVLAVVVPPSVDAAVRRLAAMRGCSRSAVVRDFLVEVEPVLIRVANLLDMTARADRNALRDWAKELAGMQSEFEVAALNALAQGGEADRVRS